VKQAKKLIEKIVENQGWTDNHLQGMNNIQLVNSISLDSLLNRLDERANWKRDELLLSIILSYEPQRHMNIITMLNIVVRGMLNLFLMMVGITHRRKQHIRNGICATIKVILLVLLENILFLIRLELMRNYMLCFCNMIKC